MVLPNYLLEVSLVDRRLVYSRVLVLEESHSLHMALDEDRRSVVALEYASSPEASQSHGHEEHPEADVVAGEQQFLL
jgi:hypothetical protein